MNTTSAKEWLVKVWHDLSSANILFEANHYTDNIGVDLHYAISQKSRLSTLCLKQLWSKWPDVS